MYVKGSNYYENVYSSSVFVALHPVCDNDFGSNADSHFDVDFPDRDVGESNRREGGGSYKMADLLALLQHHQRSGTIHRTRPLLHSWVCSREEHLLHLVHGAGQREWMLLRLPSCPTVPYVTCSKGG